MTSAADNWQQHVVLAYLDEPPFGWEVQGLPTGADIDLATVILQKLGVARIDYRKTSFAELIPGLISGEWDICVPMFVSPERATQVAFSTPVWCVGDGFLLRPDSAPVSSYEALALDPRARLGLVTGQIQIASAKAAGMPAHRLAYFQSQTEAIAALRSNEIDAYASTALGNRTVVRMVEARDLVAVDHSPRNSAPFGAYSFARKSVSLLQAFDAALRSYLGSPEHRDLVGRYGFTAAEIDPAVHQMM